jgi:hypothetical protein
MGERETENSLQFPLCVFRVRCDCQLRDENLNAFDGRDHFREVGSRSLDGCR